MPGFEPGSPDFTITTFKSHTYGNVAYVRNPFDLVCQLILRTIIEYLKLRSSVEQDCTTMIKFKAFTVHSKLISNFVSFSSNWVGSDSCAGLSLSQKS